MTIVVHTWGFDRAPEVIWPPDLQPIPLGPEPWPEGPVVVHAADAQAFAAAAAARPLPNGRLPEAILYRPPGIVVDAETDGYFDAEVLAEDWDALRRLLACPQQIVQAELAEELPLRFLQELDRPIAEVATAELPLAAAARAHLAECAVCRLAFDRAVEERLRQRRLLLCPDTGRLAAYARGAPDAQVQKHLLTCRACQAEVAVLSERPRPTAQPWLNIPLLPPPAMEPGQPTIFVILAALVQGAARGQLTVSGARLTRRGGREALSASEVAEALAQIGRQGQIKLVRPHRDLVVGWDAEEQAIWLGRLHGAGMRSVAAFRVEVRRGEQVLWQGESHEGRTTIPIAALEEALHAGADQVVILEEE